jgi:hypothetical protein
MNLDAYTNCSLLKHDMTLYSSLQEKERQNFHRSLGRREKEASVPERLKVMS